jgi:hypothetical protein
MEFVAPSSKADAPTGEDTPRFVIPPSQESSRIETGLRAVALRRPVEAVVFDSSSPALHLSGRFASFARDDIFDTFHSARARSVSDIPDDLFAELAVEFAGAE